MQTTHRFFHKYSNVVHPVRVEQPGVVDVYTQAEKLGGKFTRIVHNLPENSVANFSPCVIKHKDTTYIAWRSQEQPFGFRWDNKYFYLNDTPTDIYIGHLANDETILGAKNMRPKKHRLSYEDPRLFVGPDNELYTQFVVSAYASKYDKGPESRYGQPKVAVCYVDENCDAVSAAFPPIGNNRKKGIAEKNWCFFSKDDYLHCLYSTRPLIIEREQGEKLTVDTSVLDEVTQKCPTFNSTAPINLGYGYLVFYHWKHMAATPTGFSFLLYHLGAYIVDKDFTKILYVDKEPLFSGSLNDQVIQWTNYAGQPVSTQPAVILPFGGFIENTDLVLSLGVNDAFMGIFRCPLEQIMKRMTKVD
jgi:hypothetical protein